MRRRRGKLIERPDRGRASRYAFCVDPLASIINIDDAGGAADSQPAVASQSFRARPTPSDGYDGRAHGALVDPARYDCSLPPVPFDRLASFAEHDHALAVAPPFEICHAAFAFDAHFCYPLAGGGVQDVDIATSFP